MFNFFERLGATIWYTIRWLFESLTIFPGLWKVFQLKAPRVTFFGGAKLKRSDRYMRDAKKLAEMLASHNVSIITGGGSGIMEAAAEGANEEKKNHKRPMVNSLGLSVSGLDEGYDPHVHSSFVRVKNFAMRKWLMINFSVAYIVFPGGVGTYDELAEVLTLMDVGKLKRNPIILFGKEYWDQLDVWFEEGISRGFIHPQVKAFFVSVDTVQEAFDLICTSCTSHGFKMH